jgi:hypothetical protein
MAAGSGRSCPECIRRLFLTRSGLVLMGSLLLSLGACSGGGGNSGPVAPSALSYPTPPAFMIGKAIAALAPSVTGTVTGYTISPALPAGLAIDATIGVISGTPTAVTASSVYTITASNAGGSTTTTVRLVVNDVSPAIAYASPYYSFTTGVASVTISSTNSGGAVISWSVSPALPPGLTIDASSGAISGTPIAASSPTIYTVTASNSGGTATSRLTLAVSAGALLDVGHTAALAVVGFSGSVVLSQDTTGNWVLWNYTSGVELAKGNAAVPVALAGPTAVVQTASGLTVLNASSGAVEATIAATSSWWKLAVDGSYLCAGSTTALTVWAPTGQLLLTQAGDFSHASVLAAHGKVQIALGPSPGVIQTVDVLTGMSTLSPTYQGTFQAWFSDGARFLTAVNAGTSATVFIYSSTAVQQEVLGLLTNVVLGGEGSWFWTFDANGALSIYAVGGGTTPAATYSYGAGSTLLASGTTLGVFQGAQISLVDLSGTAPVGSSATLPIKDVTVFAATSSSRWVVGNSYGVLLDGVSLAGSSPRYLAYGEVKSIAGSESDVAIATASGRILVYSSSNNVLLTTIDFASWLLALSNDGTVLAAGAGAESGLNVYTLPAGTLINTLDLNFVVSLSASGIGVSTLLGVGFDSRFAPTCLGEVIVATASAPSACFTAGYLSQVQISPNGMLTATTAGPANAATNIYNNGTLSTAVQAYALGWLDNSTFLANTYTLEFGKFWNYSATGIYSASGQLQSSVSLPPLDAIQVLSPSAIYSANPNAIFALPSGAQTWASGSPGNGPAANGAVSGSEVVFQSGTLVLAETMAAPSG